jgi:UDPglucose--hexose-1-phosphate uridylyltransferase
MSAAQDSMLAGHAHRRRNALTGEWVLVSPQRLARPWQGAVEPVAPPPLAQYDPECYLCPGNVRANGDANPDYASTFVFQNDYPALRPAAARPDDAAARAPVHAATSVHPLLVARAQAGECRVLCYSPRHDLSLADLPAADARAVVEAWCEQTNELERNWRWVQVFENRGEQMGASNPHPHGQIWAGEAVPSTVERELGQQQRWHTERGVPLLQEYAELESARGERVVIATKHWLAVVPWWAAWPFEILLLPRRRVRRLPELDDNERADLANVLGELLRGYDRLFECPFPYSFGWHGAPAGSENAAGYQLHAHFYPPLLRSATVRKFMVGYEMLAEVQADLAPEQAAERLRRSLLS